MNSLIIYSFVLLVVVNIGRIQASNLPDFVVACSRTDPKLNDCATKVAKSGSKVFALGDKERGIPPLDPIFIKEINAINSEGGVGLKVVLKDVVLTGPSKMQVKKIKIDWPKKKVIVKAFGKIFLESDYEMNGRLLIIPIVGKGRAHIALDDTSIVYTFYFDIVNGTDGKEYLQFSKDSISYDVRKAQINLENLFNGDKVLGENTNRLLNESWQELIKELGPPAAEELRKSVALSVKAFMKLAPLDEILKP